MTFNPIVSMDAILICNRFGFAKFKDVRHSEKCIIGFYHLGYEVGFARVSLLLSEFAHAICANSIRLVGELQRSSESRRRRQLHQPVSLQPAEATD
jgi:hypothetical protein